MYAVMNPDGAVYELRDGIIDTTTNTRNRQKPYAVRYEVVRPILRAGEQHVLDRRDVTIDNVMDVFRVEPIPIKPVDVEQKVEALTKVLIAKTVLTREEIDANITIKDM